ncbi:hypothetical protein TSAR_011603 [Trichomalopsis sarcophagae]|uniref:BTB domain-containing protein n=1 Tax=Trichomalopsis sarcophagae TaxID=543379 RepID=A0A232EQ32_9HYME|nr:hypothetical protein TSAR_011603 [Trichomalopsis sarcophagae]
MKSNVNSSFLEIKDIQIRAFKPLLQYIYTDEINNIDETLAKELIVAAIKYDIKGLATKCEEILCKNVNVSNVIEIFEIADQHNITQLKSQTLEFVADHASVVMNSKKFATKELEQSKSLSIQSPADD